jgi:type I restriction enzyme, S subunit
VTVVVKIAPSSALERWDVKHFLRPHWQRPSDEVVPLGLVARRREEVNRGDLRYGSIHFDGKISLRPDGTQIKGTTYVAYPGDVVFSRIDVRNGAVGVVPQNRGKIAFTNEFPIYSVAERRQLLPDFVRLILRTRVFRAQVEALVVGHSGRKRVSAEMFEQIPIPVPLLAEQEGIILNYRARLLESDALFSESRRMRDEAVSRISEILGLSFPDFSPIGGPFAVEYGRLEQWSAAGAMTIARGIKPELESKFPVRLLGEEPLSAVSYGLQVSPLSRPGAHARPYLRVANVQDGYLDLKKIKKIEVPPDLFPQYRLVDGDILLCEGNSAELVGRPAIWRNEIDGCVHQNHILRVRLNAQELLPGYVLAYMQTRPSRIHFRKRAKKTTNLATINSTDVRELEIPVPPLEIQKELAELWELASADAIKLQYEAEQRLAIADEEAETAIAIGWSGHSLE